MAADLGYSVEITGLKELREFETRINSLNATLKKPLDASGLKAITAAMRNMNGVSGSAQTIVNELQKLQQSSDDLKGVFRNTGSALAGVFKSEMAKAAASIRNDVTLLGEKAFAGVGDATAKSLQQETRKISGAANLAKAELNAAYNKLVGEDGGREYLRDPSKIAVVRALRDQGATISGVHAQQLKLLDQQAKSLETAARGLINAQNKAAEDINRNASQVASWRARSATRMTEEDVRYLLKVPSREEITSFSTALKARLQAEQRELENVGKLRAKSATPYTTDDFRHLMGLPSEAQMAEFSAKLKADLLAQQASIEAIQRQFAARRQVALASLIAPDMTGTARNTAFADMLVGEANAEREAKRVAASMKAAARELAATEKEAAKLNQGFNQLTVSGGNLHGMARGLASGFNALWLTWGNMLPLIAGAAISHGFMQTAKQGMEVSQSLGAIAALGIDTSTSISEVSAQVKNLTASMIELGHNGPFGPRQVAEAMKTLSLAGLEATKIAQVLPTVLNFSMAGDTSIEQAADVLVSVTTAFGTGAEGFERSADIIMRAAADSKASVESFGSAMKTASVVGEQFNASQEDVAVMIQYLANLGIQGTAAGTAIRNMYSDLSGRSGQTSKIIKQLGLDFRDTATGGLKPLKDMAAELLRVLQNYDKISQKNIQQALLSERGGKAMIEVMAMLQKEVEGTSGKTNQLYKDIEKFSTAAGDSAVAAAKRAQETLNAWKAVGASLETTMFQAFQQMEPMLYDTALAMQKAFASPELKDAMVAVGTGISTITKYVAENIGWITQAVKLYVEFRVVMLALNGALAIWTSLSGAAATATAALTTSRQAAALSAANYAATQASVAAGVTSVATAEAMAAASTVARGAAMKTLAGTALKAIPVIGNVIAGATVAWSLYDMWANRASKTTEDYADQKADKIAEALEKETAKISEVNAMRSRGLTLLEAEAKLKLESAKAEITASSEVRRAALVNQANEARNKQYELDAKIKETSKRFEDAGQGGSTLARETLGGMRIEMGYLGKDLDMANEQLKKLDSSVSESTKRLDAAVKKRKDVQAESEAYDRRDAAAAEKRQKETLEQMKSGNQKWNLVDFQEGLRKGGKGRKPFEPIDINKDGELQNLRAALAARASIIEAAYGKESRFLDMRREGEIISEGEYLKKSFELASQYEADKIRAIEEGTAKLEEATAKRRAKMEEGLASTRDPMAMKMYQDAIAKEANELKTAQEKATADIEKIKIESNARIEQSFLKLESTAYKLIKTDRDYWSKRGRDTARAKEVQDLEKAYENVNKSVFSTEQAQYAAAKAQLEVKQATEEHIESLKKELQVQLDSLEVLQEQLKLRMQMSGQNPEELQTMQDGVNRLQETIDRLRGKVNEAIAKGSEEGAEAGSRAFNLQWEQQAKEVRNTLADAATTALLDGGKAGAKKLRDYLQEELLRKPLNVMINGLLQGVFGSAGGGLLGMLGGLFGMGGGSGGEGSSLVGNLLNGASAVNTGYGIYNGTTFSLAGRGLTSFGTYTGQHWATGLGMQMQGQALPAGMVGPGSGVGIGNGSNASVMGLNGGWGAAGVMMIPLIAAYLGGMFKEERQVGQGITGRLGGDLYGYQLMRESGSMFSGPDYRYVIAEKEIKKADEEIARLKKEIEDNPNDARNGYRQYQLQNLYSRRERLHELYDPSIEGLKGPIKVLDDAFRAMRETTASQADTLGLDGKRIREMTVELGLDEIHPDTGGKGLQLTGLTQEEAQKKIEEALAQANEQMAREVLGTWKERTREVTSVVWDVVENGTEGTGGDTNTQSRVAREVTETITEQVWEMSEFVREGETAVQALGRLSTSLVTANAWFETIGKNLYATSLAGADMASQLMDAFGGQENFLEKTNQYFQAFYSDAEKTAIATAQLGKQFKAAGVEMPATREAFRALAEAQDLTTEEGRKTYAALMNLAGAADQLYTASEAAAAALKEMLQNLNDGLLESQGRYKELVTAQHNRKLEELRKTGGQEAVDMQLWIWYYEAQNYLRKQEIEILKAQGKEMEAVALEREMELKQIEVYGEQAVENAKKLWALQDEAKARAEKEAADEKKRKQLYDQLAASINREKTAVEKLRDETQGLISDMEAVVDAAGNAARELYNTIERTAQKQTEEAKTTIAQILATLRAGGKAPKANVLSDAISQARVGLSSENYLTEYEYQRQTLILAGQLAQIGELTDGSLTIEEQQLAALTAQLEQFDKTLEYYEKQLGLAEEGIDATMSVGAAVAQIEAFLRGAREEDKKPTAGGSGSGTGNGTTAPKDPWGADYYQPGNGGATLGGVTPGATRNPVVGYTKDGKAIYKDGTIEKYGPGEYKYEGNQLVGSGSLTAEQWAKLQAGQEPFPGYWAGGQYNSNGKYTWSAEKNMYVPSFDTGINVLPHDTYAQLHAGEAVVPAKYNEFNPNVKNAREETMIDLLTLLVKESTTQTGVQALNVELTEKLHELLDNVTEGGNAMRNVNMEPIEIAGTVPVKAV